jgi:hypothetical protein
LRIRKNRTAIRRRLKFAVRTREERNTAVQTLRHFSFGFIRLIWPSRRKLTQLAPSNHLPSRTRIQTICCRHCFDRFRTCIVPLNLPFPFLFVLALSTTSSDDEDDVEQLISPSGTMVLKKTDDVAARLQLAQSSDSAGSKQSDSSSSEKRDKKKSKGSRKGKFASPKISRAAAVAHDSHIRTGTF